MVQSQVLEQVDEERSGEETRVILLASAAAEGDESAFAELYALLSQRVFNLVLRSVRDRGTAEDLCQEIWLRVHREIRDLRAPEAMRSWLYRIASHACVDFARSSRGKHRKDEEGIDEFVAAFGREPEETAIVGSEVRLMWQTLGAMAPRQSMALYLKQVDGLSYDEIALVLECTRPTVEALLFRARQSFVRAYRRVESSPAERCEMFSQVMTGVIDHEPTALQRSALESHAADCVSCRPQLAEIRRAHNAYLALPLLPIGKALALETILAGGGTAAGAGIFTAAAGLFGAGALPAKIVLVGVLLTTAGGAVATGQIEVPVISDHVALFEGGTGDRAHATDVSFKPSASGTADTSLLSPSLDPIIGIAPGSSSNQSLAGQLAQSGAGIVAGITTGAGGGSGASNGGAGASSGQGGETVNDGGAGDAVNGPFGPSDPTVPGQLVPTPGPTETLVTALVETTQGLAGFVDETIGEVTGLVGDTVTAALEPVTELIEPVDNVVEDLTGLSVTETLEDVTNALPGLGSTPVPLGETVEDVLEPVEDILEDPLAPVEGVLEDPLAPVEDLTEPLDDLTEPVEDLTEPILGPLLPSPTPVPDAIPPPDDGLCVLGLLLC